MKYRVGTRGSALAIAQTRFVIEQLKKYYPEDSYEMAVIATTGDKSQTVPLDSFGMKGIFTDTIERALLEDEIQFAVHSMKDMPDELPPGLVFSKTWKREDARDVLVLRDVTCLDELPQGARIATGSKRRAFQLKKLRPDIQIMPIRGNVDTRIRKLKESLPDGGLLDGVVLAAAGMKRLGREAEITQYFGVEDMIPAAAQGSLALELREENTILLDKLNALSDECTEQTIWLERQFIKAIGAGCHAPAGAYADFVDGRFRLFALLGSEDGKRLVTTCVEGMGAGSELVEQAVSRIMVLYGER